jgi:hypothetical protein
MFAIAVSLTSFVCFPPPPPPTHTLTLVSAGPLRHVVPLAWLLLLPILFHPPPPPHFQEILQELERRHGASPDFDDLRVRVTFIAPRCTVTTGASCAGQGPLTPPGRPQAV